MFNLIFFLKHSLFQWFFSNPLQILLLIILVFFPSLEIISPWYESCVTWLIGWGKIHWVFLLVGHGIHERVLCNWLFIAWGNDWHFVHHLYRHYVYLLTWYISASLSSCWSLGKESYSLLIQCSSHNISNIRASRIFVYLYRFFVQPELIW